MKTKNKIPMRQCTGCREMKNKKRNDQGVEKPQRMRSFWMLQAGKTVAEPTSARAVSVWRKPEKITDWSVL